MHKKLALLILCTALFGCSTFEPRNGMTYQQFYDEWLYSSTLDRPKLAVSRNGMNVYELKGTYYYFINDRLVEVDQGQKIGVQPQNRYQVEIK